MRRPTDDGPRIEDYALIGDCETAALVSREGSIDWLCFPRFDSPACFAALLGTPDHGHWRLAPVGTVRQIRRQYREGTLVLETEFNTVEGRVALIDCMPPRSEVPDVLRVVQGRRGRVSMRMELAIRFDYGSLIPWVRRTEEGLTTVGGVDLIRLRTPVALRGEDFQTVAEFTVAAGEEVPFGDWREWLLRAVAGTPSQAQMIYAVAGERLLPEWQLSWLPGFAGSSPVRIGNAAYTQLQLDVYGEHRLDVSSGTFPRR